MVAAIYCHECGSHSVSENIIVKCYECDSRNISFKISENEDSFNDLGFISSSDNNLIWTEFLDRFTFVYSLRKNYSVIPTLCYDIINGIISDPITEDQIDLKDIFNEK